MSLLFLIESEHYTWPVARTNLLGEDIKIIDANYIQQDHDMAFGEIKAFSKDELLVSAKGGYISINKLQLEGKRSLQTEIYLTLTQNSKIGYSIISV